MSEAELEEATEAERGTGRLEAAILSDPIRSLQLDEPAVIAASATLAEAVETLQRRHTGCVLVVGEGGKLAGIFTERDLLNRVAGKRLDWAASKVSDYMTRSPETLHLDDRIAWALNLMHLGGYRNVPLTDAEGRPIGIVSVKNVVEFIVDLFPSSVLNLPPDPHREPGSDTEGGGAD
jgi:CBS domain-containing protein